MKCVTCGDGLAYENCHNCGKELDKCIDHTPQCGTGNCVICLECSKTITECAYCRTTVCDRCAKTNVCMLCSNVICGCHGEGCVGEIKCEKCLEKQE